MRYGSLQVVAVVVVLLCLFPGPQSGRAAEPGGETRPSIAVLDFAMEGAVPAVDDRAAGLADFLAMRFRERGIATLERQDLGYLLSERQLQQDGPVESEEVIRSHLPWVRYLVKGTIADLGGLEFAIEVSVVDARSAAVVTRQRATGRYPNDVAKSLGQLAGMIVESLGKPALEAAERTSLPGFTEVPELALLFSKGLYHYLKGRPEFAAEYFRQAYRNDPDFLLAAVWWMRAYEYLGLERHVALLRRHILARPGGVDLFAALAATLAHDAGRLVLDVVPADPEDADHRELASMLTNALATSSGAQVFSPEWIQEIASEIDLEVSGQLPLHATKGETWLTHDATLIVGLLPAGRREVPRIRLQLTDPLSGEIVAQAERGAERSRWLEAGRDMLGELLKEPDGEHQSYRALRPIAPFDYPPPERGMYDYSEHGYAYYLRDFSEHPGDPAKIMAHHAMHVRHDSGVYRHIHTLRRQYRAELYQMLFEVIDDSTPGAPNWLSHALWNLLYNERYFRDYDHARGWFHAEVDVPLLETHFAPLLERYPASFAALCVRYAIAHALTASGRHAEAAALFRELATVMPALAPPQIGYHHLASLYYFAARAAQQVGDKASAMSYSQDAIEAVELFETYRIKRSKDEGRPEQGERPAITPVLFHVGYATPAQPGSNEAQRWIVSELPFAAVEDGEILFHINQPMNEYMERLHREVRGESQVAPGRSTLEELAAAIGEAGEDRAVQSRLAFIRMLSRDMARMREINPELYLNTLPKALDWLRRNGTSAATAAIRRELPVLVDILQHNRRKYSGNPQLEVDLYLKAGMAESARVIAQEWFESPREELRHQGILAVTKVRRSLSPGNGAGGAFCEEHFADYEARQKANGKELDWGYLDLLHACAVSYEADGQPQNAAQIYRRNLEQPIFDADAGTDDTSHSKNHHRVTLIFNLARMEESMGNLDQALALYKHVVERTESHRDWYQAYSGNRSGGAFPLNTLALHRIERLRRAGQK